MRRLCAALLLASVWVLAACERPAPPAATAPALWRVSDSDSEIWLFGSVHVLPPELAWRNERLNEAFAAADEFVTETDTDPETAAAFPALARRYGTLPEDQSLRALLNANDAARLDQAARDFRLDAAALDRMRPWFAALQLSYAYALREGHVSEAGVEAVLSAEARARGKRMSFFETPEEQIQILANLAPEDERHFLSVTLRQFEGDGAALDAMDQAWARGDIDALARDLQAQWREAGPAIHEAVILRRNRAWAEEIAHRLEGSGVIFVTVGAAHLVGEGNVVDDLRARGIAVEGP
ncbi:MAG: TraB/GumN family protein [Caulobacterales bacterium]|jgi:uncharacterized protein YbaP (TraB family)|nr:TraB/GumN family protein [Caulobacterales bacterium]